MLHEALAIATGPAAIRWPKGPPARCPTDEVGSGLAAPRVREGTATSASSPSARCSRRPRRPRRCWPTTASRDGVGRAGRQAARPGHARRRRPPPLVVTVEDGMRRGRRGSPSPTPSPTAMRAGRPSRAVVILGRARRIHPPGQARRHPRQPRPRRPRHRPSRRRRTHPHPRLTPALGRGQRPAARLGTVLTAGSQGHGTCPRPRSARPAAARYAAIKHSVGSTVSHQGSSGSQDVSALLQHLCEPRCDPPRTSHHLEPRHPNKTHPGRR